MCFLTACSSEYEASQCCEQANPWICRFRFLFGRQTAAGISGLKLNLGQDALILAYALTGLTIFAFFTGSARTAASIITADAVFAARFAGFFWFGIFIFVFARTVIVLIFGGNFDAFPVVARVILFAFSTLTAASVIAAFLVAAFGFARKIDAISVLAFESVLTCAAFTAASVVAAGFAFTFRITRKIDAVSGLTIESVLTSTALAAAAIVAAGFAIAFGDADALIVYAGIGFLTCTALAAASVIAADFAFALRNTDALIAKANLIRLACTALTSASIITAHPAIAFGNAFAQTGCIADLICAAIAALTAAAVIPA